MNTPTLPSNHKWHYVYPASCGQKAILAIDDGKGEGGFDLYFVDKDGYKEVDELNEVYPAHYWQDRLELKIIQNIYSVLDEIAFIGQESEIVNIKYDPNDDIPF